MPLNVAEPCRDHQCSRRFRLEAPVLATRARGTIRQPVAGESNVSESKILLGKGEQPVFLDPRYANRHGLVAGATGTGKTVTLMLMAERF